MSPKKTKTSKIDQLELKLAEVFGQSSHKENNFAWDYLPSPSVDANNDLEESLKVKEEEVKVLWNVIKELNKTKGEKLDLDQLSWMI